MACLPISLRSVLPGWIQSFFLSDNDDASFWGGDEDQITYENSIEAIPHKTSTYVTTKAAIYSLHDSNSIRDLRNSKQIEMKPHICRSTGEFAFQTRTFDTAFLLAWSLQTDLEQTSSRSQGSDSEILVLPTLPPHIHLPVRGETVDLGARSIDSRLGRIDF